VPAKHPWTGRWLPAACVTVAMAVLASGSADARAILSSVREIASVSSARVVMFFPGGVPAGWHLEGSGTDSVTAVLPETAKGIDFTSAPAIRSSPVESIAIASANRALRVLFRLTGAEPVTTQALPSALVLLIGSQPRAVAQAAVPAAPTAPLAALSYTVIPLKYADVSEIADILVQGQQLQPTDNFHPSGSMFSLPTSGLGMGGATGANDMSVGVAASARAERVTDTIAVDRRLNALILSGPPDEIASIKSLVSQIDVPLDSVMLDCQIVELTESSAHDLGLDLAAGAGGPIAQASVVFGNTAGALTGGTGNTQTAVSLEGQLYATIAHGGGKILATPRILALDGTPAQILAGDAIPIIQSTIYPGSTAITQVSTTYVTVGINLQILPRISGDNQVLSYIYAEVSSVAAYVPTPEGNVPQISLRRASTEALVQDGSPFVIAGLLQDNEIRNMSKLPILGDLPIIGGLFRVRRDSTARTNLYIVVTPHIIRQRTDAAPSVTASPHP